MKILAVGSTIALVVLIVISQLPTIRNSLVTAAVQNKGSFNFTQSKSPVPSYTAAGPSAYGRALATLVDNAVKHVKKSATKVLITNEDMLATMCLEMGDTYINEYAKHGRIKGSTASDYGIVQFQPPTFKRIVQKYNLFYIPRSKGELIKVMNNPEKSILVGAYYKNELLIKCKNRGFTGDAIRKCAAVGYNGGSGKIAAMPKDGSPPNYCYCTESTKHLSLCKGADILPKAQRGGKMSCITKKYGYDGLAKCVADIKRGGGNKLKSSLWRSLIASTHKLENGGVVASTSPNLFSVASVKDITSDWWYTAQGQEVGQWQSAVAQRTYFEGSHDNFWAENQIPLSPNNWEGVYIYYRNINDAFGIPLNKESGYTEIILSPLE